MSVRCIRIVDRAMVVLGAVAVVLAVAAAALSLSGCGSVARVAAPVAAHEVVSSAEYAAAEEEFGGGAIVAPAGAVSLWTVERCQETLDRRDALVAVTAGLGGLTGAGGLATVIPEDASRDMRLGFGITTVVLAAATTAMTVAIKSLSDRFEMWCNTTPPPVMVPMTPVPAPPVPAPPTPDPVVEARDAGME
jgi:uncharacterized protein YceK